jgi:hypothetical protein
LNLKIKIRKILEGSSIIISFGRTPTGGEGREEGVERRGKERRIERKGDAGSRRRAGSTEGGREREIRERDRKGIWCGGGHVVFCKQNQKGKT